VSDGASSSTGSSPIAFSPPRALAVGAGAGLLSGLFGVGGGIVIVPGLVAVIGLDQRRANGTSLAAIFPIAGAAATSFIISDSVDYAVAALLASGTTIGVVVGTWGLRILPQRTLRVAFIVLLLVTAVRLFLASGDALGRADISFGSAIAFVSVGLLTGALSGLLGVGGGVIMVPAMLVLFDMPSAVAKGTDLLVIVATAAVGTRRNLRHGNADLRVAAVVGAGGAVVAVFAARISVGLSDTVSATSFAVLLLVIGGRMAWAELHRDGEEDGEPRS